MDMNPGQISMAMINADDSNAGQQKGKSESHIVVVVHRAHEHRKNNHGEYQACAGRQYVDSVAVQADGTGVRALTPPGPLARAAT
jgi:hypothetical protein